MESIIAIDAGTTSSRTIAFNKKIDQIAISQFEFTQIFPKKSWVEHDPNEIWEDNIGGAVEIGGKKVSFYVDTECILCSVCSDAAPNNFRMSDDEDHDICYKQPDDEDELEQCYEAMENCPVEAIGDDGPDA